MSWEEQRRAPRTSVDVEAALRLGHTSCQGVIVDLSTVGSLFRPEQPLEVRLGVTGHMRFALPTSLSWLEPRIEVKRSTAYTRPNGEEAQAIGFEFSGLRDEEQRAIAAGCLEWDAHRTREYPLAARCYLQGEGDLQTFSRYGRLIRGSRNQLHVSLARGVDVPVGGALRLKLGNLWVSGEVRDVQPSSSSMELVVRLTDSWGRDFFLHEARREVLSVG